MGDDLMERLEWEARLWNRSPITDLIRETITALTAERQTREQLERDRSGAEYVLAGVMDALEGKPVSECEESFGPVRDVMALRQAREQAEQERDQLRGVIRKFIDAELIVPYAEVLAALAPQDGQP
jgi:hypothetical protein